jgi:L-alanine-DL-glutamate epimerase-like enolase superfamily enzyme
MKLSWTPYTLEFKHPFRIAHGVRTSTPVVFVRLQFDGLTGYGEAALPPYLGEDHQTVDAFLRKLNLQQFNTPFDICAVLDYTDKVALNNTAAKAAIDMALHDLIGKLRDEPTWKLFGADPAKTPLTSFTIGMDEPAVIREKIKEAKGFPVLKIKLGGSDDLRILEAVKAASPDVFSVDANQGWTDREYALDMVHRLKEMNASFVEQPFLRTDFDSHAWLKERSPLPLIADESCQRLSDLAMCKEMYRLA